MKFKVKIIFFAISVLAIIAATQGMALGSVSAAVHEGDQFVVGESYTLPSGDTLNGNLWVLGGNATLESGSQVNGNVRLAGGSLHVFGQVTGNISAAGGLVEIGSTAVVHGNVSIVGASLNRSAAATIDGTVNTNPNAPIQVTPPTGVNVPGVDIHLAPFWNVVGVFFRAFLMAALAILVVMFWPNYSKRTAKAVVAQPLITGGMGLLTVIVTPLLVLVMLITIVLIPASILGLILLGVMIAFGWIAIGMEVGLRLEQAFKLEWALPVAAGLGTFAMTLVVDGIGRLVPCVGWLAPAAVGLMGLGAVLLTRFGSQDYPTYYPSTGSPVSLVIPAAPQPPAPSSGGTEATQGPSSTVPEQPGSPDNPGGRGDISPT